MRLFVQNVKDEDKELALSIRNTLKLGRRVIGNPAEGLKKTLRDVDTEETFKRTEWQMKDPEKIKQKAMLTAGIEGEEELCDYLGQLIRYDERLHDIIAFASLSYEQDHEDYIPDTDVLLVYGNSILIIDAKKLKVNSNKEYSFIDWSVFEGKKEKIHINSSVPIWKKKFPDNDINDIVCVVGDIPMNIVINENNKLMHISELQSFLVDWVKDKSSDTDLAMLVEIGKAQIKKTRTSTIDVDIIKKKFSL